MRRTIVFAVFLGFCLCGCLFTVSNPPAPGTTTGMQPERPAWHDDPPTPRMFGIDLQGS